MFLDVASTPLKPSHETFAKATVRGLANFSRQDARLPGRGCTAWILSTEAAFLQAVRWKPSVERNPVTDEREDAKNDEV